MYAYRSFSSVVECDDDSLIVSDGISEVRLSKLEQKSLESETWVIVNNVIALSHR